MWAHNGRELFYWRGESEPTVLVTVEFRTEPTFAVLGERELFVAPEGKIPQGEPGYAVEQGDQRFLLARRIPLPRQPARMELIHNFFEELKATRGN